AMALGGEAAMTLKGKHALVTGGSRGIGRGIALKLAETGARVAIHYYVNEAAAKETLERVRKHGSDGFLVQADVSRVQDIQRMFARVRQEFGTLDIFVANARPELAKFYQKPMEITLEAWDHARAPQHHGQLGQPRADRRQRAERLTAAGRGHRAHVAPARLDADGAHGHPGRHRQRGGAAVLSRRQLDHGPAPPRRRRCVAGGHASATRDPAGITEKSL